MSERKSANTPQSMEELRNRYQQLNELRIQAETRQKTALEQLELLRQGAREQFGTDDLDKLKEMLEQRKSENERKRAEYQKSLEQIEVKLAEIDRQFSERPRA